MPSESCIALKTCERQAYTPLQYTRRGRLRDPFQRLIAHAAGFLFANLPASFRAMTKADLIAQIAEGTGLTKVETRAVVEGFMTTVQNAMKDGKRIELRGFGVFEVQHRAPRTGRNPQTNEPVEIEARYKPVFRPSDKLSEAVDAAQKAERE